MKCKNCGKEINDNDLFCEHCGAKQEAEVNNFLVCPKCGAKNNTANNFCQSCGTDLISKKSNVKQNTSNIKVIKKEEPLDQTIMYTSPLPQEPKKKSKAGLIIGLVAGGLVIIGLLAWFFVIPFVKENFFPESELRRSSRKSKDKEETTEVLDDEEDEDDDIFSKKSDDKSSKKSKEKEEEKEVVKNKYYELNALDNVKVREYYSTDSDQVGKIAKGSSIMAYAYQDTGDGYIWYRINNNEWVANDGSFFKVNEVEYIKDVGYVSTSIGKINVTKDTSVYDAPSSSAKEIGWLTVSTKMLYYEKEEAEGKTWLKISGEGYVPLDHVEYYYK